MKAPTMGKVSAAPKVGKVGTAESARTRITTGQGAKVQNAGVPAPKPVAAVQAEDTLPVMPSNHPGAHTTATKPVSPNNEFVG